MYTRHLIVDFEWTSIPKNKKTKEIREYARQEIIQIGAVLLDQEYNKIGTFCCYVKPEFSRVSKFVTSLTGITNESLTEAASLQDALMLMRDWIGDDHQTSTRTYSFSSTDMYVLEDETYLKGIAFPRWAYRWMDIQRVFQYLIGYYRTKQLSLKVAVNALDLDYDEARAHDGLYDAELAAMILCTIKAEGFQERVRAIRELTTHGSANVTIGDLIGVELMAKLAPAL